jgi:malonyl CoA-acyl carrier protein transacylase
MGSDVMSRWDTEAIVLSAASREQLAHTAEELRLWLDDARDVELRDVAFTLHEGEAVDPGDPWRLAIVASTIRDLAEKLARAEAAVRDAGVTRLRDKSGIYFFSQPLAADGDVAFVFPGEGSQYPRMLADLCQHFPVVRAMFELAGGEPSPDALWQMNAGAQAVWAANQAMAALMRQLRIRPRFMAGHSMGEHSALFASGLVRADTDDELVEHVRGLNESFARLERAGEVAHGVLMAVGDVALDVLESLCASSGGTIHIALDNCPHQVILCGTREAIDSAMDDLRTRGAICQPLPFERAYHTPWFARLSECLRPYVERVRIGAPSVELFSSVTAQPYPDDPGDVRQLMMSQCARRVRFRETVEALYARGARIFIEVGPKAHLTGFIDDTLRGRPHIAIPSDLAHRSGIAQLHHLLAQLAAHHVPFDAGPLFEGRSARRIDALAGLARPSRADSPHVRPPHARPPRAGQSRTLAGHLDTMARFLQVERDVMQTYLTRRLSRDAPSPPATSDAPRPPFAMRVEAHVPGQRIVAACHIDPREDRWILDHVLGRDVSAADPGLTALPVVPLTISMEILAQTAARLRPAQVLIGMTEVRASRWITLEDGAVTLRVTAESSDAHTGDVRARIEAWRPEFDAARPAPALVEATMHFAPAFASADAARTPADRFIPPDERPSAWTPERIYRDAMFHGPAFQAVSSVDRVGREGIRGTLRVLPRDTLFTSRPEPRFVCDPVLVDGAGQLLALWAKEILEPEVDVFPYRVEALRIYGPAPRAGITFTCHVRAGALDDERTRCDMTLANVHGEVYCEIEGWEDRRCRIPRRLAAVQRSPRQTWLSAAWRPSSIAAGGNDAACAGARLDDLHEVALMAHGGIWMHVLAHIILSRAERAFWRDVPAASRCRWLLGRTAAKDAVRRLVSTRDGQALRPADIEIWPDESGRLRAHPAGAATLGCAPLVSVSTDGGAVVAAAALDGRLVESHIN